MSAAGREGDALWAAVGDPTRRQLLDALLTRGEASATALAAELPVTRQAVAKHLAVLDRAGLVAGRKEGREVLYAVRPSSLDAVSRDLAKVAASWDRRLATIKRLAEAAHAEVQGHKRRRPA
jgi:DNA-binding transcriptional ArsR family regulator